MCATEFYLKGRKLRLWLIKKKAIQTCVVLIAIIVAPVRQTFSLQSLFDEFSFKNGLPARLAIW